MDQTPSPCRVQCAGLVFAVISLLPFYRFLNVAPSTGKPSNINDFMGFVLDLPGAHFCSRVLGVGMILFVLYSLMEGRYRHINVEDAHV